MLSSSSARARLYRQLATSTATPLRWMVASHRLCAQIASSSSTQVSCESTAACSSVHVAAAALLLWPVHLVSVSASISLLSPCMFVWLCFRSRPLACGGQPPQCASLCCPGCSRAMLHWPPLRSAVPMTEAHTVTHTHVALASAPDSLLTKQAARARGAEGANDRPPSLPSESVAMHPPLLSAERHWDRANWSAFECRCARRQDSLSDDPTQIGLFLNAAAVCTVVAKCGLTRSHPRAALLVIVTSPSSGAHPVHGSWSCCGGQCWIDVEGAPQQRRLRPRLSGAGG